MSSSTDQLGSEPPDERLVIGHVARAHGIRGDVLVKFYSDDPRRFGPGDQMLAEPSGESLVIARARPTRGGHLVSFAGVDDRDRAESLRGERLTIPAATRRSLGEGEFWPEDLTGLEARNPQGRLLGRVVDVVLGDAQDRIVVELEDGARADVPFVDEIVPNVDPDEGFLVVVEVPGLFD